MKEKGFVLCMTMIFLGIITLLSFTVLEKSYLVKSMILAANRQHSAFELAEKQLNHQMIDDLNGFTYLDRISRQEVHDCAIVQWRNVSVYENKLRCVSMNQVSVLYAFEGCVSTLQKGRQAWWLGSEVT